MEPIPYYYDHVSRSAVSVKPKQPLLDWINALYPELPEDGTQTTVYLVKMMEDRDGVEKWLKNNFRAIFENELNERHAGEEDWPQKRTRKLFDEWFETNLHTYVADTVGGFIKKM